MLVYGKEQQKSFSWARIVVSIAEFDKYGIKVSLSYFELHSMFRAKKPLPRLIINAQRFRIVFNIEGKITQAKLNLWSKKRNFYQ